MMTDNSYKVYITCLDRDKYGNPTKDYILAKLLYKKLEKKGIRTFLIWKCDPDDRREAICTSRVLIVAGVSAETIAADNVRNDYDYFVYEVERSGKRKWRIFNFLRDMKPDGLPDYLRAHRSYDYYDADVLAEKIESILLADDPKACVSDDDDGNREEPSVYKPESLPDSANDKDDDDDIFSSPVRHGHGKARRAPSFNSEEIRSVEEPSCEQEDSDEKPRGQQPSAPLLPISQPEKKPVRVKPAKVNKVEFSVVAPEEVKPGKSSVIDLLMYTRSQRSVVKRTIEQAKEKSSEAARSTGSVSVRHGSRVTAELFSDDMEIQDGSRDMVWNGDALDFKFRVKPPEDYSKKEIDFGCRVEFDGIEITRLYFSVPIGSKKKAAVRFTRRDCRRAFVSYSHKDRMRVAEQLLAIQEVAPKLRFWMDSRSMTAGDVWRRAIASAIKSADVFLLFWSVSAKDSPEVRSEWEYALSLEHGGKRVKNGMRFISPVPLDSPAECPPPEELSDLHFGDPSFDSDIENIEKVKVWAVRGRNIRFL